MSTNGGPKKQDRTSQLKVAAGSGKKSQRVPIGHPQKADNMLAKKSQSAHGRWFCDYRIPRTVRSMISFNLAPSRVNSTPHRGHG
jgi:hypothetical protein